MTLGLLFMVVVIFLPGGLMEGFWRIMGLFGVGKKTADASAAAPQPAE